MMRVLFITPYVPSPIRVRPYELLRSLVARGVRPTVLCPTTDNDEAAVAELRDWDLTVHDVPVDMRDRVSATLAGGLAGLPLQAAYGVPATLVRRVREVLAAAEFDVVHLEHLRAAALLPWLSDLPVVVDAVDCISLLLRRTRAAGPTLGSRAMAGLEYGRTRRFEAQMCRAAQVITVTSPEDARALQALAPAASIRLLPNGVDLDRFCPAAQPRARDTIVFSGKMSYHANVAAAYRLIDGIMPRVWKQRPSTQLWIVGSAPPRGLQRRAADPRVTVTGYVPQITPYLQGATLAVSPLRYGVGVQNKVLEAMATAAPVVVDRQCLAALQAQPDRDLLAADDDAEFARAIVRLLDDRQMQERIGNAGRAYVEQHHRWGHSATTLVDSYQQAMTRAVRVQHADPPPTQALLSRQQG
jgi:polysaccharide biosynthesis protein PslH